MKIMSAAYWNCGKRTVNEDSITLQQVRTEEGRILLAAVSDGIGGLSEGENASGYILEQLVENFYRQVLSLVNRKKGAREIKKSLLRCCFDINYGLSSYARGKNIKLGATISMLLVWKRRYLILHLGDSRIYQLHKSKVRLLTKDHSNGKNGLTKCLGSFPCQYPDIYIGKSKRKSAYLLCTDGFYRSLEEELRGEILSPQDILTEEQIEKRLQALGELALKRDGNDNISALYAYIY